MNLEELIEHCTTKLQCLEARVGVACFNEAQLAAILAHLESKAGLLEALRENWNDGGFQCYPVDWDGKESARFKRLDKALARERELEESK